MLENLGLIIKAMIMLAALIGVIMFIFFIGSAIFIIILCAGAYIGFREYIDSQKSTKAQGKRPSRGGPTS